MNMRRRQFTAWVVAACLAPSVVQAQTPFPTVQLKHCAGGPGWTIAAADPRALLADEERDALLAEMRSRYAILERDGFTAPVILMWRQAPDAMLYLSLRPNGFADNALCVTASFVAKPFGITPALTRKYFAP